MNSFILGMVVGALLWGWYLDFKEDVRWWRAFERREQEREQDRNKPPPLRDERIR